jgi:hypothetical protein
MRLLASAYEEGLRMGGGPFGLLIPCINVLEHLYVYLTQTPYLVTPLVFCFSLGGLWVLLHRPSLSIRRAMGPVLIVLGLLFASRLVPTLYQDRHQLPFIPFWILLAAIGFQKTVDAWRLRWKGERFLLLKNGTVLAVLAFEVVFSIACFSFQRESFADLRHGAEFLRQLPPEARIFTDEFPKTYYWAKRDLTPWQPNMRLPEGAYLVLHSFYTKRDRLLVSRLMENYQARVVFYEESAVTPLLSDLMEEAAYQNRTALVGMRFETQDFRTWVIRLGKTSP